MHTSVRTRALQCPNSGICDAPQQITYMGLCHAQQTEIRHNCCYPDPAKCRGPQKKPTLFCPVLSFPLQPRPHRQATTPAATRATSQAPEEDEGTDTATRARDQNPQRTLDQGTGPQGGQPHGPLPDPPARAAHPGPHSTDPARHPHLTASPNHQPATLRRALRTTTDGAG